MATETAIGGGDVGFHKTLWTVLLKSDTAEDRRKAFTELVRIYWKPAYFYIRRRGNSVEDSKDYTQEFFATFLEKDFLKSVSRDKGSFRTFLIAALSHFLSKEYRHRRALKRGGGQVLSLDFSRVAESLSPRREDTPESTFLREWVVALIEEAVSQLRVESEREGRAAEFGALVKFLTQGSRHYAEVARSLGLTPREVARRVFDYRTRLRAIIHAEIRNSVTTESEYQEELKTIFSMF
jgi:RNA polymerase sigma factor (sigma-70 family)